MIEMGIRQRVKPEIDVTEFLCSLEQLMFTNAPRASSVCDLPGGTNFYQIPSQKESRWCSQGYDEIDLQIWELLNIEDRVSLLELVNQLQTSNA
jgi:rubredoxin